MKEIVGALAGILKVAEAGDISILLIILLVFFSGGPALVVWLVMRSNQRLRESIEKQQQESEKRFDAVVQMYEDNVLLVKNYDKTADGLETVIHLSTKAITQLVEKINNNHFCPIVRERSNPHGS